MLNQISWFTYAVSIISFVSLYYLYIGFTFYRTEIRSLIYKLGGKRPALSNAGTGDLQIPDYEIMGKAEPEAVEFVAQEELSFGPPEEPDELDSEKALLSKSSSRLIGNFSEMVSELKTLIRVINESGESKENFEMLFRLIVQKYHILQGTAYQQQVNDFLMAEGAPQFPFSLNETDLESYWTVEIKN